MNKENNREIKFRAWDKLKGKWLKPNEIEPIVMLSYQETSESEEVKLEHPVIKIPLESKDHGDGIIEGGEAYIYRYTGLKDKNGKEIYEGDIIENNGGFNKEVIFHKGVFCEKRGKDYHIFKGKNVEVIGNKVEVIGNKFETPT